MFRIWSGPEGSSHKEPLSGIRIHRARFFARFYQTAQCSMLRAAQSDNLSFKRQGMTRRSMPCLFHANLFALGGARWLCQNIDGYVLQEAMKCLVSRWSSAVPAGSLDYQIPRRRPGHVVQKSPVEAHLSDNLIPCFVLLAGFAKTAADTYLGHWWPSRLLRLNICNELLTHLQGSPYYHESD